MKNAQLSTIRLGLLTKKHTDVLLPFLDKVGIDSDIFQDPDYDCPLAKHVALLEIAAKGLNHDNLGLHFGKQVLSADMGLLGQALRSHNTVGDTIKWAEKYFVIHQQATTIAYQIAENKLSLSYKIDDPAIIDKRQDTEFSIAAAHAIFVELSQLPPTLLRVDFSHDKPNDQQEHKAFFGCPIYFNQPQDRLVYKAELFDAQLKTSNYVILEALHAYIEELHKLRSTSSNFMTQLDIVISKQLSNGGTNLPRVADEMAMSSRTLQRRLAELDIQFGDHVEDLRKTIALHYITDNKLGLTDIALLLGYSEASSFSRAFKRWTGQTPKQYRIEHAA